MSPARKALRRVARGYRALSWALDSLYDLGPLGEAILGCAAYLNGVEGEGEILDLEAEIAGGARGTDPDTAKLAALKRLPLKGSQRREILELHVRYHRGLTDSELKELTDMVHDSLTTRRSELVRGGWLEDSGMVRVNEHGIDCVVWRLSAYARKHFGLGIDVHGFGADD